MSQLTNCHKILINEYNHAAPLLAQITALIHPTFTSRNQREPQRQTSLIRQIIFILAAPTRRNSRAVPCSGGYFGKKTAWTTLVLALFLTCASNLATTLAAGAQEALDQRAITHLQSGTEHLKRGEIELAREEFNNTLKYESSCYQALNNMGLCDMRQGMLDAAADKFRQALKVNPNYVGSLNNLGIIRYLQGHYEEAIIFYDQALKLSHNKDSEIHTNLANALRDKGDYSAALDHYRQSIKLQPDYAAAYNNLGLTLLYMRHEQEAAVQVTKAIKLKPHYAEAYYNLGLIYKTIDQPDKAKSAFEKSLSCETNPTYAEATRKIISALSSPKTADDALKRGCDLLGCSNWNAAEAQFKLILKNAPGSAVAWNNLGLALARQRELLEAVRAYNKALSLTSGGFSAAHFNLGQALKEQGDRAGAEKAFLAAITTSHGRHPEAHVALGILLKEDGDKKGAVQNYKLAILQSGDTLPVVHFNLGIALETMDSAREAVREYRIYLSQAPQGANAESARLRLRRLGIEL